MVPELIFVLSADGDLVPEAYIHATSGLENRGRVMRLCLAGGGVVDASNAHQILGVRTEPAVFSPLVSGTAERGIHLMTRNSAWGVVSDMPALEFQAEAVKN